MRCIFIKPAIVMYAVVVFKMDLISRLSKVGNVVEAQREIEREKLCVCVCVCGRVEKAIIKQFPKNELVRSLLYYVGYFMNRSNMVVCTSVYSSSICKFPALRLYM
jgi:hypothetical protein